ncbi:MAG: hypothetical protein R3B67_13640 [Phycisphaerales bacterium]
MSATERTVVLGRADQHAIRRDQATLEFQCRLRKRRGLQVLIEHRQIQLAQRDVIQFHLIHAADCLTDTLEQLGIERALAE